MPREKILILVKTCPEPSMGYIETTCVAGITEAGEMRRIFPVPFRFLDEEQQFKKWQWISIETEAALRDNRKESRRGNFDTIQLQELMKSGTGWRARMEWLKRVPRIRGFLPPDRSTGNCFFKKAYLTSDVRRMQVTDRFMVQLLNLLCDEKTVAAVGVGLEAHQRAGKVPCKQDKFLHRIEVGCQIPIEGRAVAPPVCILLIGAANIGRTSQSLKMLIPNPVGAYGVPQCALREPWFARIRLFPNIRQHLYTMLLQTKDESIELHALVAYRVIWHFAALLQRPKRQCYLYWHRAHYMPYSEDGEV